MAHPPPAEDLSGTLLEAAAILVSFVCSTGLAFAIPRVEGVLASFGGELPWLSRFMLALLPVHCGMFVASLFAGVFWVMEWTGSDGGIVLGMRRLAGSWVARVPGGPWLEGRKSMVLVFFILSWFCVAVLSAFSFVVLPQTACCTLSP
ncbi:MAG: hypothetical protein HZB91_11785 [Elusimicrobia bacterium]|nr:hypothetical protein [Elusimicrobiota bacterium]